MFFFDTYAMLEMINGNPAYSKFGDETIITSVVNIAELYYSLLKDQGREKAELWIERLNPDIVEIDVDSVKIAMVFRLNHKEKKLSYIDCIGYALAQKLKIKFLTGDRQFEHIANVEFVK